MYNKAKAMTVNRLLEYFKFEKAKGHGDYVVFVTDDEEANGYHALWYIGECSVDMDKENREFVEERNCDLIVLDGETDKAIYLG